MNNEVELPNGLCLEPKRFFFFFFNFLLFPFCLFVLWISLNFTYIFCSSCWRDFYSSIIHMLRY